MGQLSNSVAAHSLPKPNLSTPRVIVSGGTRNFCGEHRGENAFPRGQKSKNLQKMADFAHFFFGGGGEGKWEAEANAPMPPPP